MKDTLHHAISRAERVTVRNALNPLLWLTAVVTPVSLFFSWASGFDTVFGIVLIVLGCLPTVAAITAYFIWMIRDPDRLQSEDYQLEQRRIDVMERKSLDEGTRLESKPPTDDYVEPE